MLKNTFLNNKVCIWPSCGLKSKQTKWLDAYLPFQHQVSLGRVRHQAFAVGFFGFHYIRATVENVPSIRKDSRQRLMKLLADLQIAGISVEMPGISGDQPYVDFKEMIIKRISLELGDHFSPTVQWMVEFGFHLAVTYSSLVAATEYRTPSKRKDRLNYLVLRFPYLLRLAEKSELSETILGPLVESWNIVRQRQTKSAARKCCELLGLVINRLLVTKTAVKLLN